MPATPYSDFFLLFKINPNNGITTCSISSKPIKHMMIRMMMDSIMNHRSNIAFTFSMTFHFMMPYFFRLDRMYFQCKKRCITIVIKNISAVHSWTVIRKCLTDTNTLPLASYPLGNTSQFNRPVTLTRIKRIKDNTLTAQSLKAFSFFINFHLWIKKRVFSKRFKPFCIIDT